MANHHFLDTFAPHLHQHITHNVPVALQTWFRVGGAAHTMLHAHTPDILAESLATLPDNVPMTVLGATSNMLIRDGGIDGLTINLGKEFRSIHVLPNQDIRAGAAVPCSVVARTAAQAGIAGLEFLRGIPGTIGGAAVMNAGAYTRDCAAIMQELYVVTRQGAQAHAYAHYAPCYRHTTIDNRTVVAGVLLRGVSQQDPAQITARMDELMQQREQSQPVREKTGGSTFKNPDGQKAWQLIDAAGCRGLTVGGAVMSPQHCNFMINTGTASAHDLETLGHTVQQRVYAHTGVHLTWEIRRVGQFLPHQQPVV